MKRVATDVGGTFTDLVHFDPEAAPGSSIVCAKVDSTPPGFELGVMNALAKTQIRGEDMDFFVHGSTIIINTLTERKGVKTALITTRGFRDVLEIARGNRPDLFNFRYRKPEPLVPRYLRREVTERIDYKGNVLTPLKTGELRPLVDELRVEGVDAIAVCFLHAYRNPDHELVAVREIQRLWPEVAVIASHVLSREWREYERTNTTAAAASVQPVAYGYLSGLEASLADRGFSKSAYVMLSNGGIDTFAAVRNKGITMVESGPAAGVFGAATLGRLTGTQNLITLDIGGTTAKCSLIENGRVRLTNKYVLERTPRYAGYPLLVPVVDIVEIGNGGGSIAWLDDAGKLRVGPRSAGADPGPAAYGRGGKDFTTTDAHLLTGRIDPGHFLGGEIKVDLAAMNEAAGRLCKVMNVSREELARGVIRIANNNMVNALKLVSLNRGYDPRDFSLVIFGGGGGLHGTDLARTLQIPEVIVPVNASVFSCWGMLQTDLRRDRIVSVPLVLAVTNASEVDTTFRKLEMQLRAELESDRVDTAGLGFQRMLDMRYEGQEHTVKVDVPDRLINAEVVEQIQEKFRDDYEREYSYRLSSQIEVVNFHVAAVVPVEQVMPAKPGKTGRSVEDCIRSERQVDFGPLDVHRCAIYERALLEPGMLIEAPAIIDEPDTTIVVDSGRARVDDFGNIRIEV